MNEAWRFPLVRVEGLSGSAKKNFAGLLRGAGVGAAAVELDRAEDGGRARLAGGRFRVASPEAAERAVGVLNGMRVEGWELKARWEMDEGVRWEVVDGQRAG